MFQASSSRSVGASLNVTEREIPEASRASCAPFQHFHCGKLFRNVLADTRAEREHCLLRRKLLWFLRGWLSLSLEEVNRRQEQALCLLGTGSVLSVELFCRVYSMSLSVGCGLMRDSVTDLAVEV